MSKFSLIKNSFRSGKMSQSLEGRTELAEYSDGCLVYENMITKPEGGATKIPGTFGGTSTVGAYNHFQLDLGSDGVIVIGIKDIPASNDWDPSFPTIADNLITSFRGQAFGGGNFTAFSSTVVSEALSRYQPNDDWKDLPALSKDGWQSVQVGRLLILTHNTGSIPPIIIKESNNFDGIFEISTIADNQEIGGVNAAFRSPYTDNLDQELNIVPSGTTGTINLTMEDSGSNKVPFFNSNMSRAYIKLRGASSDGLFRLISRDRDITETNFDHTNNEMDIFQSDLFDGDIISFSEVDAGVLPPELSFDTPYTVTRVGANSFTIGVSFSAPPGTGTVKINYLKVARMSAEVIIGGGTTANDRWAIHTWNDFYGWPSCASFYSQRLVLAGVKSFPNQVANSFAGNLFNYAQQPLLQDQGATDSSGLRYFGDSDSEAYPFTYEVGVKNASKVIWITSQRSLQIGTNRVEYVVIPTAGVYGRSDGVLSLDIRPQTFYGSYETQPIEFDVSTIFVEMGGRRVRTFRYSDNNGSNISENYNILNEDMLVDLESDSNVGEVFIKKMVYAQEFNAIFVLSSDKKLYALSLQQDVGVRAWSDINMGGDVEDICYINTRNGVLQLSIDRGYSSGNTSLEYMYGPFRNNSILNSSTEQADVCNYLFNAIEPTTNNPEKTNWQGIPGDEGDEVVIVIDGEFVETLTINAFGNVISSVGGDYAIVGRKYTSKIKTMPLEGGSVVGSSQSLLKRVDRATLKLHRSRGGKYSFEGTSLFPIEYPDIDTNKLFSGAIVIDYDSTNEERYSLEIEHDEPYPFTVLALVMRGESQE